MYLHASFAMNRITEVVKPLDEAMQWMKPSHPEEMNPLLELEDPTAKRNQRLTIEGSARPERPSNSMNRRAMDRRRGRSAVEPMDQYE